MIPRNLLLLLGAAPFFGDVQPARPVLLDSSCPNVILYEPVLVYEVRGGTLVGAVDQHLTVYSDGSARLSDISNIEAPRVELAYPGPEAVSDLCLHVERWGGMLGCDATVRVMDVPLHTLTLLKGGPDARAHTFSWWVPEGSELAIEQLLGQFLADNFPGG